MVCPVGCRPARRHRRSRRAGEGRPRSEVVVRSPSCTAHRPRHFARDARAARPRNGDFSQRDSDHDRGRRAGNRRPAAVQCRGCRGSTLGADRGDRFETVPRYRGEPSPRGAVLGGGEAVERVKVLDGWSTRRFTAAGWPGKEAFVYLSDGRIRVVSAWLIAAMLFFVWVSCRDWLAKFSARYLVLVVILIAGLLLEWLLPARFTSFAGGRVCRDAPGPDRRAELEPGRPAGVAPADRKLVRSPHRSRGGRLGVAGPGTCSRSFQRLGDAATARRPNRCILPL